MGSLLYNQTITKGSSKGVYMCILHNEGAPAIETPEYIGWYHEGKLHRLDGPAWISKSEEETRWYKDGVLHREDGPAIQSPSMEVWYLNGKYHRIGGPAYIDKIAKIYDYYEDGVKINPI